jgi:DNA-binding response OmpR family regulator
MPIRRVDLVMNLDNKEGIRGKDRIVLTVKEFQLLEYLYWHGLYCLQSK